MPNQRMLKKVVRRQIEAEFGRTVDRMLGVSIELLKENGYIVCPPDSVPLPRNLREAEIMNTLSENYILSRRVEDERGKRTAAGEMEPEKIWQEVETHIDGVLRDVRNREDKSLRTRLRVAMTSLGLLNRNSMFG